MRTVTTGITVSVGIGGSSSLAVIIGIIAALVRHSLWAGLAFFLLTFVVGIIAVFGFIPVAGPFIYWLLFDSVQRFIFHYAQVRPGELAHLVFILGLIFAIIYTLVATFFLLVILLKRD